MTPDDAIVQSAAERIAIAFDVDTALAAGGTTLEQLRQFLVERIIHLLNTNPERLMSILYRVDVNEQRVNEIFRTHLPPDMPEAIADLMIERQLAKAESRAKYRAQGGEQ
jgi:hypothetical protein